MTGPTLHPPVGFSQPGKRDNNEDFIYPLLDSVGASDRLFLVCDGVGGGVKGEVASRIVAEQVAAYFRAHPGPSDDETVMAALRSAEAALDMYLTHDPSAVGMATTMTLLHLHELGATVAHVGDSRVCCCRNGQISFETDDHKLVNEWVKQGILTPEQAADHPEHNVITRAVRSTARPAQADVTLLKGLQADDYFFLCTDGVLENLTAAQLSDILATAASDADKVAAIRLICDGHTQDNYSAYLNHVQSVDGPPSTADGIMTAAPATISMDIAAGQVLGTSHWIEALSRLFVKNSSQLLRVQPAANRS